MIKSFLLRLTLTLLILLNSSSLKSQTDWEKCCRGYEEGYKNGYSYPDLYLSNTVAPAPCNCVGIIGTLTYEVGYIKGYEEGKNAKAQLNKRNQTQQTNRNQFQSHDYIPPLPFDDYKKAFDHVNLSAQSQAEQINNYLKFRDLRQLGIVRQCDVNHYVQEKNKINKAAEDLFNSHSLDMSAKFSQYVYWINQFENNDLISDIINNSKIYNDVLGLVERFRKEGTDVGFIAKLNNPYNNSLDASTAEGHALFQFYLKVKEWKEDPSIYATLKNSNLNKTRFLQLIDDYNNNKPKVNGCVWGNCINGMGVYYEWNLSSTDVVSRYQKFPVYTIEGNFKNGLPHGRCTKITKNVQTGVRVHYSVGEYKNGVLINTLVSKLYEYGKLTTMDSMNYSMYNFSDNRKVEVIKDHSWCDSVKTSWFISSGLKTQTLYKFNSSKNKICDWGDAFNNIKPIEGIQYSDVNLSQLNKVKDTIATYYGGFRKFDMRLMYWQKHGIGTLINVDGDLLTSYYSDDSEVIDSLKIVEHVKTDVGFATYRVRYYGKECISLDRTMYDFFYFIQYNNVYKYTYKGSVIEKANIPIGAFLKRFNPLIAHRKKYFKR